MTAQPVASPTPRPVIFDLDGVIVDTEPLYERAFASCLERLGERPSADLFRLTLGRRDADVLPDLAKQLGQPLEAVERELARALADRLLAGAEPMPFALQALDTLGRGGRPLGLATSTVEATAERLLGELGIRSRFAVLVCGDQVAEGKPNPEAYLRAASELDVAPQSCLAIEDSSVGVRAVVAAGMTCIVVPNQLTATDDLSLADYVADDLREAAALIQALESARDRSLSGSG
jgi:HAD superfamily hydrolase (TIGR01509 family)